MSNRLVVWLAAILLKLNRMLCSEVKIFYRHDRQPLKKKEYLESFFFFFVTSAKSKERLVGLRMYLKGKRTTDTGKRSHKGLQIKDK